jgi:hypothetical protein
MRQPIGSRLHGALDYLTGTGLIGASALPALRGRYAGRSLRAAGAAHLAYSLLTDYELGAFKLLPYKAHLGLDAGGALGLAGISLARRRGLDRWLPVAVGAYELGALALSDPQGGGAPTGWRAVTVQRPLAEVQNFLTSQEAVRRFAPDGEWSGDFRLREAPAGRGTEIHAEADAAALRRAKQLLEAGEIATASGPAGRRGPLSALLPTLEGRS